MAELKKRILYIDDDISSRELGVFNLEKAGYEIDCAANGKEGLRLFSPARHDLVITDIKMPELSGIAVLRNINQTAPHVPVVVITAYLSSELTVTVMKIGAFGLLSKPFNRDEFIKMVERALNGSDTASQMT